MRIAVKISNTVTSTPASPCCWPKQCPSGWYVSVRPIAPTRGLTVHRKAVSGPGAATSTPRA